MNPSKADILARLQKEILPLQGYKPMVEGGNPIDLGPISRAFPQRRFPLAAVHEFLCFGQESAAATTGFISGIFSQLMNKDGVVLWISPSLSVFPPSLVSYGLDPDRVIFVELRKTQDCIWAMEEALKCESIVAVACEVRDLSFTISRRFQLAVEKSRVTGFIMRRDPRKLEPNSCIAQWQIKSIPGELPDDLPGVGFPRWNVELLKVRNGHPGSWQMEWVGSRFKVVYPLQETLLVGRRKTG